MRCHVFLPAALIALALPLGAAVPAASTHSTAGHDVSIRDFHFVPGKLVVPAGARVTWTNRDEEPHVVTSVGNRFKSSSALDTHDRFSVVFTKPGTYPYFCSVHPFMTGTIVVR